MSWPTCAATTTLVNLLQGLAEALLFYHPVTWWLSHRIRDEREHVADRVAADATGEPRRLALALAALAEAQAAPRHLPQPALAALGGPRPYGGQLMSRIEHLVRPGRARSSGRLVFPLLGLAAAGRPGLLCARPARTADHGDTRTCRGRCPGSGGRSRARCAGGTGGGTGRPCPGNATGGTRRARVIGSVAAAGTARAAGTSRTSRTSRAAVACRTGRTARTAGAARAPGQVGVRQHGSGGSEPYALVRKDDNDYLMSGSSDDMPQVEAARRALDSDFLWFRRNG